MKFSIILLSVLLSSTVLLSKENPLDTNKPSGNQNRLAKDYETVIESDVLKNNGSEKLELIGEESIKYYNRGFDEGFEEGKKIAEEAMVMKLLKMERYLDSIFNFQRLYIENKIEPPKIMIRKTPIDIYNNGSLMTIDQEQIEIIGPAKLISNPKSWRNYLITN